MMFLFVFSSFLVIEKATKAPTPASSGSPWGFHGNGDKESKSYQEVSDVQSKFSSYDDQDPSAIGDDPTSFNFDSLYHLPMRFILDGEKAKEWMDDTEVPEVIQRPGDWWDVDPTPSLDKPLPEPVPQMGGRSGLEVMKGEEEVPTAIEHHQITTQLGGEAFDGEAGRLTKSPSEEGTDTVPLEKSLDGTGLGVQEETPSQDPGQDENEEDRFEINEEVEKVQKDVEETGVQKDEGLEDGGVTDEEPTDGDNKEAVEPPSEIGYLTPQETPKYSQEIEGRSLK